MKVECQRAEDREYFRFDVQLGKTSLREFQSAKLAVEEDGNPVLSLPVQTTKDERGVHVWFYLTRTLAAKSSFTLHFEKEPAIDNGPIVVYMVDLLSYLPKGPRTNAAPMQPGFPSYPPIKDADPQVRSKRTFVVPTRLIVRRTAERIEIAVDANSLETIELTVGHKMVAGFKHDMFVVSGDDRKHWGGGLGGTANIGTSYINQKLDGIPKPDEKYIIEITFVVFETDVPVQHMWMPGSGKYKELWSRTLKSEEL